MPAGCCCSGQDWLFSASETLAGSSTLSFHHCCRPSAGHRLATWPSLLPFPTCLLPFSCAAHSASASPLIAIYLHLSPLIRSALTPYWSSSLVGCSNFAGLSILLSRPVPVSYLTRRPVQTRNRLSFNSPAAQRTTGYLFVAAKMSDSSDDDRPLAASNGHGELDDTPASTIHAQPLFLECPRDRLNHASRAAPIFFVPSCL